MQVFIQIIQQIPLSNCADGTAAAFKSREKLSKLKFVQFHPTALENSNILISESARGEGLFIDNKNKRFIDELKSRDEVKKAIYEKLINKDKGPFRFKTFR